MLKKHPAVGRLVRLPSRIVTVTGFHNGFFSVRLGTGKTSKVTESMMMTHGILVPKDCCEEKKPVAKQDYINQQFKLFFDERAERDYQEKFLKGFKIEDEVVEGFEAIAEN